MVLYNKKAPKDGAEFAEKLYSDAVKNISLQSKDEMTCIA